MADFTYTAKRQVQAGHTAGTDYTITVGLQQLDGGLPEKVGDENISLSGNVVSVLHRLDRIKQITTAHIPTTGGTPSALDFDEFFSSVANGEQFTFDEFGRDLTADTITDDDVAGFEVIHENVSGFTVASFYTTSVYIRKDAIGRATRFPMLRIRFTGATTEDNYIRLDTSTGEINTFFDSTAGISGVESVGDYWRIYISAQSVAANTSAIITIYPSVGASAGWTFSTAATGSITAWGAIATEGDALLDYDAGLAVNVLTFPEDFDNAAWTKSGTDVVTANTDKAPDLDGSESSAILKGDPRIRRNGLYYSYSFSIRLL